MKTKLLSAAIVLISQSALAIEPPITGGQMQQIRPLPVPEKMAPEIRIEPGTKSTAPSLVADQKRILVKSLSLRGQTLYSSAELLMQTGFTPNSQLSLKELDAMARRIGQFYRDRGYFVAQAYLPQQEITDGAVTIVIAEGEYGEIVLNNRTNLSSTLPNTVLDGLKPGDQISSIPLESRLLLLSDIPGVRINSTLKPGASVGTSDLIVNVEPGQRLSGSIDIDNAGNRYTGANRIGASANLNNALGLGDVFTLRGITSGRGLDYVRGAYQMQIGKATAGVAYSHMAYELGKEFSELKAHGTVKIASIFGSYPLLRSRNNNLNATLAYDDKRFRDHTAVAGGSSEKHAKVLIAGLHGDHRDNFWGGGFNAYSLSISAGNIDLRDDVIRRADAATARSNGNFGKLGFSALRLQSITQNISLYAAVNGQVASKNLDVSEKMELGGMNAVRAYPEGEAYGDEGYVLSLEARLLLPKFYSGQVGRMQLIGFADSGTVTRHKNPWDKSDKRRTLSGAGVGINWMERNNFMIRTYYAAKLGNEPAISAPDKSGRFWIQLVKYF